MPRGRMRTQYPLPHGPRGAQTKAATVHRPRLWAWGGGGGHAPTWSPEPPGPAQPKIVGATQPAIGTHHAIHPKPLPYPIQSQQSPPGGGGRADRRLPEKEKANKFLSTKKGLPKGEGTHSTNQDQSCNSYWVYYSLASKKLPKEGAEGVQRPEGSRHTKKAATTDVVTNAHPG